MSPVLLRLTMMLMLVSLAVMPTTGSAHWTSHWAVDGSEIRWTDNTKYDDARTWAIDRWNALGAITILPDAWNTVNDLDWRDVNVCGVSWAAQYVYRGAPGFEDYIEFNDCTMPGQTNEQRFVALHELGHALGLGHHTISGNVMYWVVQSQTHLGSHDVCSYNHRWWGNPDRCGDPY